MAGHSCGAPGQGQRMHQGEHQVVFAEAAGSRRGEEIGSQVGVNRLETPVEKLFDGRCRDLGVGIKNQESGTGEGRHGVDGRGEKGEQKVDPYPSSGSG